MSHSKTLLLSLLALCAARADAQPITEFPLPYPSGSGPLSITAGPDGNLWFTEESTGNIGRITPSGQITEFPTPSGHFALNDITVGPDGNLWFTEEFLCCPGNNDYRISRIGRVTTSGAIREFPVPELPFSIASGPDGNLWFTEISAGSIGRMTPMGVLTQFRLPSTPYDIVTGPDGNLWFTDPSGKIGRMSTAGDVATFAIPTPDRIPKSICVGPDGSLWFLETDSVTSALQIARITVAGNITEFPPFGATGAGDITTGPDGNIWFTAPTFSPDNSESFGYVTPAGKVSLFRFSNFPVGPTGIATGPDGNLWVTETSANKIARISSLQPLCSATATSSCLSGGRFSVQVAWRSTNVHGSGSGQAKLLTSDTSAFWFFQPSNIELVVKVLDGRTVNGKFWVFYGALSNVEYTITVTDTATGTVKTYFNPEGTLASVADTDAF